jgi:hypothetical protein
VVIRQELSQTEEKLNMLELGIRQLRLERNQTEERLKILESKIKARVLDQ